MKVKVCGLKYEDNITQVVSLNPDYVGFIFYLGSKRCINENFVMPDLTAGIKRVGVFVNTTTDFIIEKTAIYDLDCIQLHGDESASFCEELSSLFFKKNALKKRHIQIIKAFGVDDAFDFRITEKYKNVCDFFLYDAKTERYGGSGKQFDWTILEKYHHSTPFFLSGGIGFDDLKKIEELKVNVYSVDVNSKFEVWPGWKNIVKLRKFCNIINNNSVRKND